jgi:hypothetical protein
VGAIPAARLGPEAVPDFAAARSEVPGSRALAGPTPVDALRLAARDTVYVSPRRVRAFMPEPDYSI